MAFVQASPRFRVRLACLLISVTLWVLAAFPDDDRLLLVFFLAMIPFFINHSKGQKTAFGLVRDEEFYIGKMCFINVFCHILSVFVTSALVI